jgi:predicted ATPase/class 3 adenylate cyclase
MPTLPSGTVTLLFSDIEGSTALLSRLGPAYADALDAQRDILRRAWSAHDGIELGTEGDSFYVVFADAGAAVAAAVVGQLALAAHPWPDDEPVRVRMGIHTGSPRVHGDAYVGMDVHRAARVANAAHGGQVVLSASTAALVESSLAGNVRLRDLGTHRLRDLPTPERIFQLEIEGLRVEFPPLRTLGAATGLPEAAGPLIGRDAQVSELVDMLTTRDVRLVTLTGPGGIGKTRLAVAVAQRLASSAPDGVFFVPLAGVTTVASAWAAIGEQIGVDPDRRAREALLQELRDRRAVYVLDNLEQLDDAGQVAAELLAGAPGATALATSRRPLHIAAEFEHPVPPLALPDQDTLAQASSSPAVQLFVNEARRVRAGFAITSENVADLAAISRRLDGLPLALELAAARTKLLSPHALLSRLDGVLDLSDGSVERPTRQRTLRHTISCSYELLSPPLQGFFRRLGAFCGGADMAAVEAVAVPATDGTPGVDHALDAIGELVDLSLVTVGEDVDGEPRFELLETLRAYAVDQLADGGELETIRERHARHYLAVAEDLAARLTGDEYIAARTTLDLEDRNLQAALGWALPDRPRPDEPQRTQIGVRLAATLGGYWTAELGCVNSDGSTWLHRAVERGDPADSVERAKCLLYAAALEVHAGDVDTAAGLLQDSAEMSRRLDDLDALAAALSLRAMVEARRRPIEQARRLYDEAIALVRKTGNRAVLRTALHDLAVVVDRYAGEHDEALALRYEALAVSRELGSPHLVVTDTQNIACSLRRLGRLAEANDVMRAILLDALTVSAPGSLTFVAEDYGAILAELGDARAAALLLGAADAQHARTGPLRPDDQEAEIADAFAAARASVSAAEWDEAYERGKAMDLSQAIAHIYTRPDPAPHNDPTSVGS